MRKKKTLVILFLILIFIHLIRIKDLNILYVLDDEFGYWSIAAYFAGTDWSSSTSNIAYYSYGYSFILTPLFWIFKDTINMYQAAIVINSIFLSSCLFISYSIGKRIFSLINKKILMFISFTICLYPTYIVQGNIAWSESLLIFLCWILFWLFLSLNNKSSIWKYLFTALILSYSYMVHQRCLGLVLAGVIVILFMYCKKKITIKQLLIFLITIIVMLVIHKLIKQNIQTNLWFNNYMSTVNDYSGQGKKIMRLLTQKGFIRFIMVCFGHIFYIGASTYLIAYLGIYYLCKFILDNIKDNYKDELVFGVIFIISSFALTFGIDCFFMSNPSIISHVTYGRYIENILVQIMFIGMGYIICNRKKILISSINSTILFTISIFITNYSLKMLNLSNFSPHNSVSAWMFYKNGDLHTLQLGCFSIVIFIIISILFSRRNKKDLYKFLGLGIITSIFLYTGIELVDKCIIDVHKNQMKIMEIVDYIDENNEVPVYFILDKDYLNDTPKDIFQFLMNKKQLKCITREELESIEDNAMIITSNEDPFYFNIQKKYKIERSVEGKYNLWIRKNDLDDSISLKLNSLYSSVGNNNLNVNEIVSNGEEGLLTYGPYMRLDRGNYGFKIQYELDLKKTQNDEIGTLQIISGNEQLNDKKMKISDFDEEGKFELNISCNIKDTTKSIEIKNYVYNNVFIKIKSIEIIKSEYYFIREFSSKDLFTQNGIEDNEKIKSNGKEGFLTYGPYISLNSGEYSLCGNLKISKSSNNYDQLGYIDIISGDRVFFRQNIYKSDINDDLYNFNFPFNIPDYINNLEFRIYTKEGVLIETSGFKVIET